MTWPGVINLPNCLRRELSVRDVPDACGQCAGKPWAVQVSTNLVNWVSVFTNQPGGAMDFVDAYATNSAGFTGPGSCSGATRLRGAERGDKPHADPGDQCRAALPGWVSTNQGQLTTLATNFALGEIQTTAASAIGSGDSLSTFLSASQPEFLASSAQGIQGYSLLSLTNLVSTNSWIKFSITKTNGQTVVVAVTNLSHGNPARLSDNWSQRLNTNSALQGSDGVVAGDYLVNPYGTKSTTPSSICMPGVRLPGCRNTGHPHGVVLCTHHHTRGKHHPHAKPVRPPAPKPSLRHGRCIQPGPELSLDTQLCPTAITILTGRGLRRQ